MTDPTRESIDAAISKWTPAALEVEPHVPTLPVRVLAGDLSTTMRYMHLSPAARDQAIDLLDEVLSGAKTE